MPSDDVKINYKVLGIILLFLAGLQFYLNTFADEDQGTIIVSIILIGSTLATALAALYVAKTYWGSEVFGRAYFALSLGFFSLFIGELIYRIQVSILEIDAYPSVASDIFYAGFYPFALIHLLISIKFFNAGFRSKNIVCVTAIAFVIIFSYAYSAHASIGEFNFDFAYGFIFVFGASVITAFAIFGAWILKSKPLGRVWFLLVIGILVGTIGDVWYHNIELTEGYDQTHVVNLFWYASYAIIIYALFKHQKIH